MLQVCPSSHHPMGSCFIITLDQIVFLFGMLHFVMACCCRNHDVLAGNAVSVCNNCTHSEAPADAAQEPAAAGHEQAGAQQVSAESATTLKITKDLAVEASQWEPDSASATCRLCAKTFGIFRRRHHCRNCGRLVCNKCSKYAPAPIYFGLLFSNHPRMNCHVLYHASVVWIAGAEIATRPLGNHCGCATTALTRSYQQMQHKIQRLWSKKQWVRTKRQ